MNLPGVNAFTLIVEGEDEKGVRVRSRQIAIAGAPCGVDVEQCAEPLEVLAVLGDHRRHGRAGVDAAERVDGADEAEAEASVRTRRRCVALPERLEAVMAVVREHGYSIRKLADKLGKDKGYLENRLTLNAMGSPIRIM